MRVWSVSVCVRLRVCVCVCVHFACVWGGGGVRAHTFSPLQTVHATFIRKEVTSPLLFIKDRLQVHKTSHAFQFKVTAHKAVVAAFTKQTKVKRLHIDLIK